MIEALSPLVLSLVAVALSLVALTTNRKARVILRQAARREHIMAATLGAIVTAVEESPHDEVVFDVRVALHEGTVAYAREVERQSTASRWRLPPWPDEV